ncbi:MAG: SurA N-terminal domain-containing protein [Deferribacterales bacterium]
MPLILLILLPLQSLRAEIINKIYAVVGDKVITQYDLESLNPKKLRLIYEKFKGSDREEALNDFYKENLDGLIDNYVVEIAAAREGVVVSDREVEGALEDIMKRNSVNKEQLEELLNQQHQTYEQYKWKIKVDILVSRLMSTIFRPKIVITDQDIQSYIAENQASLDLSDMYELRVLHVAGKDKLDEAMADFKANGNFRDTAMKFSDDKTAGDGGYLGWVELALLSENIRKIVSATKQGISAPIEEENGSYRVFFVENFKSKTDVSGDKKATIVNAITTKMADKYFNEWLAESKEEILIQKRL